MEKTLKIIVDDSSKLFDSRTMFYKEFPSDIRQLKFFTSVIMQKVPPEIKGRNLLEKQIRELLKNAAKHGNKNNRTKKIKVHYAFPPGRAHLIIEDQGQGFQEIEAWNTFYQKRCQCYIDQNFDEMEKYKAFNSAGRDAEDNGSALFEAIKFWNGGIVFNSKKNRVAVQKIYPQKNYGIPIC